MELLHFLLLTTCKLTQVFFCCCRSAFCTGEADGVPIADADATPTIILESVAAAMAPTSFSDARPRELNTDRERARPTLQKQRRNEDEEQEARITTGTKLKRTCLGRVLMPTLPVYKGGYRWYEIENCSGPRPPRSGWTIVESQVGRPKGRPGTAWWRQIFARFGLLELTAA